MRPKPVHLAGVQVDLAKWPSWFPLSVRTAFRSKSGRFARRKLTWATLDYQCRDWHHVVVSAGHAKSQKSADQGLARIIEVATPPFTCHTDRNREGLHSRD